MCFALQPNGTYALEQALTPAQPETVHLPMAEVTIEIDLRQLLR